jgi:hypothetical protein
VAKLIRAVAFVLFVASVGITVALMMHSKDWSEQRNQELREARTTINGLTLGTVFLTLVIPAKRRRRQG